MALESYKQSSEKYKPEKIITLFIAESPPVQRDGEELFRFKFTKLL